MAPRTKPVVIQVRKGYTVKEGRKKVINKALRTPGVGDIRAATYDPATGKGTVL